jgi:hypothetical protein
MQFVFFIYFILKSDYKQVFQALKCLKGTKNPFALIMDAVWCSLKYGTSLDDYFSFRFYAKRTFQRNSFASTTYMYNFHKALNDKEFKLKIDDKSQFRKYFAQFTGDSEVFTSNNQQALIQWIKRQELKELVIKDPLGTVGKSIHFLTFDNDNELFSHQNKQLSLGELFRQFSKHDKLYIEPKIKQHPEIQKLAPTALNTIRVITVVRKDGGVDIISAAFRISVDSETDNFSTGNLAAAINLSTGEVISPGIKRLAACSDSYESHPVTGEMILGFQIPHWTKVIEMIKEAALVFPQVRTVGWDVAILEDKPIIIEGNPSWNKGAPQIPLDKGIKPILEKYI